jgi:hypothetical protein
MEVLLIDGRRGIGFYSCCFPNEAVRFFLLVTQRRNGAC